MKSNSTLEVDLKKSRVKLAQSVVSQLILSGFLHEIKKGRQQFYLPFWVMNPLVS